MLKTIYVALILPLTHDDFLEPLYQYLGYIPESESVDAILLVVFNWK